jgi:hypothetical protein
LGVIEGSHPQTGIEKDENLMKSFKLSIRQKACKAPFQFFLDYTHGNTNFINYFVVIIVVYGVSVPI